MTPDLPPSPTEIVIRDATGGPGDVIFGYSGVQYWIEHGFRVRVDGECDSYCTFVFMMPRDRLCATSRARFGFHAGSDELTRQLQWAAYPQGLRAKLGRLTDKIQWLRADETGVRICK